MELYTLFVIINLKTEEIENTSGDYDYIASEGMF